MSKAKKKGFKILSILFCFLFLFLAGCDGGPKDDDFDDFEDPSNPGTSTVQSLDGVKVLSKPADYSFSDAVGECSENYYNLFSREILDGLYKIYADNAENEISLFCKDVDTLNGDTFTNVGDDAKYYLYDSPRYTITSVKTTKDGSEVTEQKISLDIGSAWNWAPVFNVGSVEDTVYEEIIFLNSADIKKPIAISGSNLTIMINEQAIQEWISIYSNEAIIPNYSQFYAVESDIVDGKYWASPYYSKAGNNYFQDALEYATYLFVLGYDYTLPEDAKYFEFEIKTDLTTKYITDILVGGWGATSISIVDALGKVKELYQHLGNYVGVNQKNKEQIVKFIKDKVIGPNAYAKNQFTVEMFENGSKTGEQKFNRNYDKIIENIVEYACSQAPIGKDGEDVVTLGENYLASQITDYDGDYFFASYENEQSDQIFKYIDEAEYQSLVLYPQKGDVGKSFTDLWLAFEYNPNDPNLPALEELTINVGFRYYSCSANGGAGGYVFSDDNPITIKRGEYATFAQESPDTHWFYISDFDGIANITVPKGIEIGSQFKNPDAINPDKSDESVKNGDYSSMTITGKSEAREYYMLNDSSSYGAFGSLNGEKFSQNNAGENACDFMEIYFDIEKVKGVIANYNFKVALVMYYAE